MPAHNHRALAERLRAHTRPGSQAERALLPRGDEVVAGAHHNGASAIAVFLTKYGRSDRRGTIRTVMLADDGEAWGVVSESFANPTPETIAMCEDGPSDDDNDQRLETLHRRKAQLEVQAEARKHRIESLTRDLHREQRKHEEIDAEIMTVAKQIASLS